MASAPLLLLLVATAAPAALGERAPADVLTAPSDATAQADFAAVESVETPKKKAIPAPAFVVVEENPPAPSLEERTPPLRPVRPGAPRGPPR